MPTGGTGVAWNPGYVASTNRYSLTGTSYDANGNLLTDTFHTYSWDVYGHPASIDSSTCGTNGTCVTYDAFGQMVEKNVAGTFSEVLYSPLGKTAVMNGTSIINVYLPLPGGETFRMVPGDQNFWHADWLGSIRLASSRLNRTVIFDRAFAPYGEVYKNFAATDGNNFTGDTQDLIAGTYDTVNRELNPSQGRWLSPDPAGVGTANPASPQSWNRYTYVNNLPTKAIDPMGLLPCLSHCPGGGGGGGSFFGDCLSCGGGLDPAFGPGEVSVDGVPMSAAEAGLLLKIGTAEQCPNNTCLGVTAAGIFTQYHAFARGGDYYTVAGPGSLFFSLESAGKSASLLAYALGSQDKREYAINVYQNDDSGVYSYSNPQQGPICDQGCTWTPDFGDIPDGATLVGSSHNHVAGFYGDTEFSEKKGGDIPTYLYFPIVGFLGTRPGNRVLMFIPSLYIPYFNGPGTLSPICVLQGPLYGDRSCH